MRFPLSLSLGRFAIIPATNTKKTKKKLNSKVRHVGGREREETWLMSDAALKRFYVLGCSEINIRPGNVREF